MNTASLNTIIRECSDAELKICGDMMADSEPWITFRYGSDECISKIRSDKWTKVAVTADVILGFVSYRPHGVSSSSLISLLCVAPNHRRIGLGTFLMRSAEEHVFSYDRNLFLFVSSFNAGAITFYKGMGYVQVGVVDDYNFVGQSELLFRKTTGPRRAQ